MTVVWESQSTWKQTCPSATFFHIDWPGIKLTLMWREAGD
jgi:hypothetical protein